MITVTFRWIGRSTRRPVLLGTSAEMGVLSLIDTDRRKTLSGKQGTRFEGLRKPTDLITLVVTLLAYGCPVQAVVHALGLDERTVARYQRRAGEHGRSVHEEQVMQGQLDLRHVQADEIRAKGRRMVPWMAMALMVSTRLWLGGVVSLHRDRLLADTLMRLVKRCARGRRPLLILTDGWASYPKRLGRAFRENVATASGQGRKRLVVWPALLIGTVIKRTQKKRVVEIVRRMARGLEEEALRLLHQTGGGTVRNTALIERINGTFRERLASLTRRCRHAAHSVEMLNAGMWLVGCPSNFCCRITNSGDEGNWPSPRLWPVD